MALKSICFFVLARSMSAHSFAPVSTLSSFPANPATLSRSNTSEKNTLKRKHLACLGALLPPLSDIDLTLCSPLVTAWTMMISTEPVKLGASTVPIDSIMDPFVESEVLGDLSHVAFDLTTLLGPTTVTLRLAMVVGRILSMAADYVPDHAMLPEELVFQHIMLFLATRRLIQVALPLLRTDSAKPSVRDRRCYHRLFRKAGISWLQYKTISTQAFEWVAMPPDSHLVAESSLVWSYQGEVEVLSQETSLPQQGRHLLGDMEFARQIGVVDKDSGKKTSPTIVRAGQGEATVLMIDTEKLAKLMKHDEQISDGIRLVICNGMLARILELLSCQ